MHPQTVTLSIQDDFSFYINKLIKYNANFDLSLYFPSHVESLKEKHDYFEVPNLETKIKRHNNPHHW